MLKPASLESIINFLDWYHGDEISQETKKQIARDYKRKMARDEIDKRISVTLKSLFAKEYGDIIH